MKILGLNKDGAFVFEDNFAVTMTIKPQPCGCCGHHAPCLSVPGTPVHICFSCLDDMFATHSIERETNG